MAAGSLAVVVEVAGLVDVEPVQPEPELQHCAPHLGHALSVWDVVGVDDSEKGKGREKGQGSSGFPTPKMA